MPDSFWTNLKTPARNSKRMEVGGLKNSGKLSTLIMDDPRVRFAQLQPTMLKIQKTVEVQSDIPQDRIHPMEALSMLQVK